MPRGGIVVVLVMACVVVLRTAGSGGDGAAPTPAFAQGTTWSRLQAVGHADVPVRDARRALRRGFRLWRAPGATPPAALRRKVLATLGAPAGARFEDARYVRTARGGIWVADAGRVTCLIQAARGAVICDATARVARRGLMLGVYSVAAGGRPKDFLVLGIAPDGAGHARLRVGGRVRRVVVRDNAYAAGAEEPIGLAGLAR
jgi:hypothetical protein